MSKIHLKPNNTEGSDVGSRIASVKMQHMHAAYLQEMKQYIPVVCHQCQLFYHW